MEFADRFSNPVIAFEDMSGIREEMQYGSYMNRQLHELSFHAFETFVSYEAMWRAIPRDTVNSDSNSQTCSCYGGRGRRQGRRFRPKLFRSDRCKSVPNRPQNVTRSTKQAATEVRNSSGSPEQKTVSADRTTDPHGCC